MDNTEDKNELIESRKNNRIFGVVRVNPPVFDHEALVHNKKHPYHSCNRNPLWYHKLIRPIFRKKVVYRTSWEMDGGKSWQTTRTYWEKRWWYEHVLKVYDFFRRRKKSNTLFVYIREKCYFCTKT